MPSFNTHVYASAGVGLIGTAASFSIHGWDTNVALLGGLIGGVGGMLPDLDSDTGKPVRIIGNIFSLSLPVVLLLILKEHFFNINEILLFSAITLIVFNTIGIWLFKTLTTHRGMFHSLPAAACYGALLFSLFLSIERHHAFVLALIGFSGYLSHLVLDSVFSLSLNPLKLHAKPDWASQLTWGLLLVLLGYSGLFVIY